MSLSMNSFFKRNAKFFGIKTTPQFEVDFSKTQSVLKRISRRIRKHLLSGKIASIEKGSNYVILDDGNEITSSKYKDMISDCFEEGTVSESLKRNLVVYVLERYAAFLNRNANATNIPIIIIKNKNLYYKDRFVKIDFKKKTLTFKTIYGDHELKFTQELKAEHIRTNKAGCVSGNYNHKQKCFICAVDVPFVAQYDPVCFLGFDLNKTAKDWIVLSNGTTISAPADIVELFTKIRDINKELTADVYKPVKERKHRSSQRRKLRLEWKALHKELKRKVVKVAEAIVKEAIDTKALLCIDSVKTGQRMGTFGQDHLIPTLQTLCENKGVPFHVVPCKNTSRRCSHCGHVAKENRISTDEFMCLNPECEYHNIIQDAQKNGAKNVQWVGQKLFKGNVPFGNWARRNADNLVKQFSPQQK